jgi:hypothetical protein
MDIIFKLSGYPDISFLKKYDNMVRWIISPYYYSKEVIFC